MRTAVAVNSLGTFDSDDAGDTSEAVMAARGSGDGAPMKGVEITDVAKMQAAMKPSYCTIDPKKGWSVGVGGAPKLESLLARRGFPSGRCHVAAVDVGRR